MRARRAGPCRVRRLGCCLLLVASGTAAAQDTAPATTVSLGSRWAFGGGASISMAPEDTGYFNYSTGAYSVLRLVRLDGSASFRAGSRVTFVGDVRLQGGIGEGGWQVRPYALFASIRPWSQTPLDVQVGLVPPVFGAFSRRAYGTDNPLIGFPLGYQYVTTLRPDALPASADELLSKRGSGWLVRYSIGNPEAEYGVPLADGLRYPVGVEVRAAGRRVEASRRGHHWQFVGCRRLWTWAGARRSRRESPRVPSPASFSAARCRTARFSRARSPTRWERPARAAAIKPPPASTPSIRAGTWFVRAEAIASWWRLPPSAPPFLPDPLRAFALDVEGRYRLLPGLYVAMRVDHLGFSEICGTTGCLPWDAPVRRVEAGAGYSIRRNVVLKGAYQYNWRDGARHPRLGLAAAQLLVWF